MPQNVLIIITKVLQSILALFYLDYKSHGLLHYPAQILLQVAYSMAKKVLKGGKSGPKVSHNASLPASLAILT